MEFVKATEGREKGFCPAPWGTGAMQGSMGKFGAKLGSAAPIPIAKNATILVLRRGRQLVGRHARRRAPDEGKKALLF